MNSVCSFRDPGEAVPDRVPNREYGHGLLRHLLSRRGDGRRRRLARGAPRRLRGWRSSPVGGGGFLRHLLVPHRPRRGVSNRPLLLAPPAMRESSKLPR